MRDDLYCIGYIRRPHGFKGELNIEFTEEVALNQGDFLFVKLEAHFIPFKIENLRGKDKLKVLQLQFVDTYEYASRLASCEIYSETSFIEDDPLKELVGFWVATPDLGKVGQVLRMEELPGQLMLIVEYKKDEVMIPFVEDFIQGIDQENKEILMHLPEGILDQE
ncbi:16S rRNA processing protein RimM [bacterium]|nr:16S rRNA processing protein RimM [bacterium]